MDDLNTHLPVSELKSLVYAFLDDISSSEDQILIKNNKKIELIKKYSQKYSRIQFRYPALFNMIIETGKEFDLQQFNMMLKMIEKVRNKEVSEMDASVEFGQKMVDKYVTPKLDKNKEI